MVAGSIKLSKQQINLSNKSYLRGSSRDHLEILFIETIQRGVKIYVYTHEKLNEDQYVLKLNYVKAKQILVAFGVQLILTQRVHSKAYGLITKS